MTKDAFKRSYIPRRLAEAAVNFAVLSGLVCIIQRSTLDWAAKMSEDVILELQWGDILGGGVVGGAFGSLIPGPITPGLGAIVGVITWGLSREIGVVAALVAGVL